MKLFGYYVWHSFVNQLKKLFKTWVLIFFVCCFALGIVIGVGAGMLSDLNDTQNPDTPPIGEEVPPGEEEPISPEEVLPVVELAIGGIILAVILFQIIGADKNGSKIFLPADVVLLFASPMKPQSVLLFRLMTNLGAVIISSIYLLFQVPNLVLNLGLSIWSAIGIMFGLLLTFAIGKLLQVLTYTVCSTHIKIKKNIRKGVYAVVILVAAAFVLYSNSAKLGYFEAAKAFFNAPVSRYIPVWGWLKAFCMAALEENLSAALASLAALAAFVAVLAVVIWRIKADFYEDAMAKSEETAQLLENARAEKSTGFVKRKKDRSEKLRRDGLNYGSGASMFFFKSMYNRFRFAHFYIFTKTSETYLVAALAISALFKFAIQQDGFLIVVLAVSGLAFFRTLGNPLVEDTKKDFFKMIPESAGKKLFWSVAGGTANCLLDALPAFIVAAIFFGTNPFVVLAWLPFVISIDFYGSNVGMFIELSVPVAAGKVIKQVVQIMFIYFGLLPDIALIAVGFIIDSVPLFALIAAAVNFAIGGLFLALSPLFLEPKSRPSRALGTVDEGQRLTAKKGFSKMALGILAIPLVTTVLQLIIGAFYPLENASEIATWIISFAPMYAVGVPVAWFIIRHVPKVSLQKGNFSAGDIVRMIFVSAFLMYGGNIIGVIITSIVSAIFGTAPQIGINDFLMSDALWLKVLFVVVLAPIIEELLFRKLLIDRMSRYGEKLAVVTSALMFGLFHGNLSQFFYAFLLGLLFGFMYVKTGKLRYSIAYHMGINFFGSVVSSWILELIDLEALENMTDVTAITPEMVTGILVYLVYTAAILIAFVIGLVIFCRNLRRVRFNKSELVLQKGDTFKTVWLNLGMILFSLYCLFSVVTTFIQ